MLSVRLNSVCMSSVRLNSTCALSLVSDRGPEVGNAVEIESDDREVVSDHDAAVVVSDARADHVSESVRSVVLSALVNAASTETKV